MRATIFILSVLLFLTESQVLKDKLMSRSKSLRNQNWQSKQMMLKHGKTNFKFSEELSGKLDSEGQNQKPTNHFNFDFDGQFEQILEQKDIPNQQIKTSDHIQLNNKNPQMKKNTLSFQMQSEEPQEDLNNKKKLDSEAQTYNFNGEFDEASDFDELQTAGEIYLDQDGVKHLFGSFKEFFLEDFKELKNIIYDQNQESNSDNSTELGDDFQQFLHDVDQLAEELSDFDNWEIEITDQDGLDQDESMQSFLNVQQDLGQVKGTLLQKTSLKPESE